MLPGRTFLLLPPLVGVLVAGCSGVHLGVIEHYVTVVNEDDSTHEVYVTITRDDSTVVDETSPVGAGDHWDVSTLDEAGDYRVVVETTGGGRVNESYTLPLVEGPRKSFHRVRIEADGSLEARVYWQD